MPPFRPLLTMSPATPTWPALWGAANQARDSGRPEKAFDLYAEALAASPTSPKPYLDAGRHALHVNLAYEGVTELYDRHAADFGLPELLGHGDFDHLSSGRYTWPFALSALQRGCELEPDKPEWRRLLAQVHCRLGQTEQALDILRRIIDSGDASAKDDRQYGRLLEQSDPAKAAAHYKAALQRRPWAADLSWHLLAAQMDGHAEADAQAIYAALLQDFVPSGAADYLQHGRPLLNGRQVHRLALLAWAIYRRPVPGMTQRALADFAPAFDYAHEVYSTSVATQLATGFASLLGARLRNAKQVLALASLQRPSPAGDDGLPDLTEPYETALQALLQIDGLAAKDDRSGDQPLPKDAQEHIAAMQAKALLHSGETVAALEQFGASILPHLVRKPYASSETVLGHRIVFHQGKFYALPHMVGNFAFIGGMVYRIPEKVHIIRPTLPRLFMRIVKPIVKRMIGLVSRYRPLRYMGRHAVRIALSRYAIRDVLIDSDFDAVVLKLHKRANMLPDLFSTSFGNVSPSTSNALPAAKA